MDGDVGDLIRDGCIDESKELYESLPEKDSLARTNMIGGYCQVGRVTEARETIDSILLRNVISWTTMITRYSQNSKVDIARKLFEVTPEKNEVSLTGYTMCGRIDEAVELFKLMPERSIVACNAMILGLGQNGRLAEAKLDALDMFPLMQKQHFRKFSIFNKYS